MRPVHLPLIAGLALLITAIALRPRLGGQQQQVQLLGFFGSVFGCGSSVYQPLTDGATITWTVTNTSRCGAVTLIHTRATRVINISGLSAGSFYWLVVKQDGAGGAALTFGSGCAWLVVGAGAGAVGLTNGPAATDALAIAYDGVHCFVNPRLNFT